MSDNTFNDNNPINPAFSDFPSQPLSMQEDEPTTGAKETEEEAVSQFLTDLGIESLYEASAIELGLNNHDDLFSLSTVTNHPDSSKLPSPSPCSSVRYVKSLTSRKTPRSTRSDTGLRFLAKKILEKVEEKRQTSFQEIADEIFNEQASNHSDREVASISKNRESAEKNTRRRVYDVLNVLVAMGIVSKARREITWVGMPLEVPEEQHRLEQMKKEVEESIQQKTAEIQQSLIKQLAYKNLLQSKMELSPQPQTSTVATSPIHLPFIAVRTSKNTVITHATSKDNLDHVFNFDQPFQIHDNMEVLMRMGMAFGLETNTCSQKNLEVSRTMVSKELHPYLEDMAKKELMIH